MESNSNSKRSRLKRKPKFSASAQEHHSPAAKADHGPHGGSKMDATVDVKVTDETNTINIALDTCRRTASAADSLLTKTRHSGLHSLEEALLAIDRGRKRQPLETLPPLPLHQEPDQMKGGKTAGPHPLDIDDLLPLPKICPCHLEGRERIRGLDV